MASQMNISVPKGLKRRMDEVEESISWSAVAAAAFQVKLGEIATRKETKRIADVVQRLRASKITGGCELGRRGYEEGLRWAKNRAEYSQLRALANQRDLQEGGECDWQSIRSFGEAVRAGEGYVADSAYIHAFAWGALAVWDEAKEVLGC